MRQEDIIGLLSTFSEVGRISEDSFFEGIVGFRRVRVYTILHRTVIMFL